VFIGNLSKTNAQCTYCDTYTYYYYFHIEDVYFGDIENHSYGYEWTGETQDFTNLSTDLIPGQSYDIKVVIGSDYYYWDEYIQVSVYFDWNQDCDFYDNNETFSLTSEDYGQTFTGTIKVPTDAKPGTTRMRIRQNYYYSLSPCGDDYYGEAEDYSVYVIPPAPDASVDNIIPPTYPYTEGTYAVSMVLGNYSDGDLGSCTINWSVNGVSKTPYYWSGKLTKGSTTQITLGTHAFVYPDGGPFNPFKIDVWITNAVGYGTGTPENNLSNNSKTVYTSPVTEDAGPIAISQPSGSFGPGTKDVAVKIKNYARKPLTILDIEWYVDGVKIGTKKWTGNLKENETTDVIVGQYNFYYKTPLSPFEITAITKNPNGIEDPITNNDTYTTNKAPSLVAGTYTIGGNNAHFSNINDATSYLSAGGVLGTGTLIFNINPGTYNEQVVINDCSHQNNFVFQSSTGKASDVVIDATTNSSNWAIGINQLDNVAIKNLTINVRKGTAAGANAIWANGSENLSLENLVINGETNPTRNENFALVYLDGISNATLKNNVFNYGSHVIFASTSSTPNYTINDNKFNDFNAYGIYHNLIGGSIIQPKSKEKNKIQANYYFQITNNNFLGQTISGIGGVWLQTTALVSNNTFSNFTANSNGNAVIMLNAPNNSGSLIESNKIDNVTGSSGIVLNTQSSKIVWNTISINTGSYTVAGISLSGSNNIVNYNRVYINGNTSSSGLITNSLNNGIIANSMIYANGSNSLTANNNVNTAFYYNTIVSSGAATTAIFNQGTNIFRRNLVMNSGTGRSVNNNASLIQSSNNNFFTKGSSNNSDLTSWINSTNDNTSFSANVELRDDGTYYLNQFNDNIVTYTPLGIGDEFELYDYAGIKREGFYYLGYSSLDLELIITQQPTTLLACNGEVGKQLEVAARISYGAKPRFQWYRNGVPIPGATESVYKFPVITYETTGNYSCLVYGPANVQQGKMTNEVLVYALRPTEIVRQSTKVKAPIGGTAFLEIEAHTKGITPPFFQHRYQWFRYIDGKEVQLMDNENYANTRSPIMTITKLEDKHFNGETNDYYFVEVEGQCGVFRSKPIYLEVEKKDVVFTEQPTNKNACFSTNVKFNANASVPGSNELINYQWYKDDVELKDDARISGSKTNELTISNLVPTDQGKYKVKAIATVTGSEKISNEANLIVDMIPSFDLHPADKTLKEGETLTLNVEVSGTEPISYQWFKDDKKIDGATDRIYKVESVELGMTGIYYCEAKNVCGTTKSNVAQIIVEKAGGVTNITELNPFNLQITPNPAQNEIYVTFESEFANRVDISILDLTGRVIYSINSPTVIGLNNIRLDITDKIANGTYFVKVNNGSKSSIHQLIITK